MVILGHWKNSTITLSVKTNCFTISIQSENENQVYSFDLEGRLWTAMVQNRSYRRGLDGKVIVKWIDSSNQVRHRQWLPEKEARAFEKTVLDTMHGFTNNLENGLVQLQSPLPTAIWKQLNKILNFDHSRTVLDIQQYHHVYKPVGILPPDQYMAVVLQATEGCSFNACTFCNFYRDRKFHIRTEDQFVEHCHDVRRYLGSGLSLRRTIFLGDANALVIPMRHLVKLFQITNDIYDVESLGGIYGFLDGFSGEKKSAQDYAVLAELGLKRIYIGMESGSNRLLKFLKKPGEIEDVIQAVRAIKEGGVAVGIIVLLGAGGKEFEEAHKTETIRAINQMPLDMDDIIYFSELVESEGLEYVQDAFNKKLNPLTTEERIKQQTNIENELIFSPISGTPHISRYDIREFVY